MSFLPQVYGRPLTPVDFVFPAFHMMTTGKLDELAAIPISSVQRMLDYFTDGPGLNPPGEHPYTTHTFRRGGAQHCFMGKPTGERWSLGRI